MNGTAAHVDLRRSIDSIVVGRRHRQDLGDLKALADSIERDGLWQLPTITPDGVLICGWRRLSAMTLLGMKVTDVWVRPVSDRLSQLLAEQDENALRKPLTVFEASELYKELSVLMAQDAAQRQARTRFGATDGAGEDGGGKFPPPLFEHGKTREQAARMVTGQDSYKTLERAARLQEIAADAAQPERVRAQAAEEVERIKAGGAVNPSHLRVNAELSLAELDRLAADSTQPPEVRQEARAAAARIRATQQDAKAAELEQAAADALARVKATAAGERRHTRPVTAELPEQTESVRYPLRAFVATWDDLAGWWTHYDPAAIGPALRPEQWERFEATIAATVRFLEAARAARDAATADHQAA